MSSILITAASNAEAYRLERILNASKVIFADFNELPRFSNPSRKSITIPRGSSQSFAHELLTTCLDLGIEKVYPLYDDEVVALSESRILFEEYGIGVIIPSIAWLKEHQQEKLKDHNEAIVVFENGSIIGGSLAEKAVPPEELANGIFNWTFENELIKYTLFTAVNADIR